VTLQQVKSSIIVELNKDIDDEIRCIKKDTLVKVIRVRDSETIYCETLDEDRIPLILNLTDVDELVG